MICALVPMTDRHQRTNANGGCSRGRPANLGRIGLPLLHNGPCKLNPLKVRDLQSLLDYIPPLHHRFYQGLKANTEDDESSTSDQE